MAHKIQAIRGMHDILPEQTPRWQAVEERLRAVLESYGYQEIRLPVVEKTELFRRSIGEVTDIVEKEMYTFEDRNGDSLTLRPEGTAGCLRACIEHGLLHNQVHRLWYMGAMFRHERPQKGRYRQFYQLGVETYGMPSPDIDAELILLTRRFWQRLGIGNKLELQVNSLGTGAERAAYRQILTNYLRSRFDRLDQDSQRRLETNPLRILDSKNLDMAPIIAEAPRLMDYLGDESKSHFQTLTEMLTDAGVEYSVNPCLVRGLDYYSKTVFEWVTDRLGAQGTVCAGGRYDGLVEQLGGRTASAIGFALGMERLISLTEESSLLDLNGAPDVYMIRVGVLAEQAGIGLAEQLRDALPNLKLLLHCGNGGFKSQFKRADKSGAEYALILGDDEMATGSASIKSLRTEGPQMTVSQTELSDYFQRILTAERG
jgi:histidyl-tRNA synthetase